MPTAARRCPPIWLGTALILFVSGCTTVPIRGVTARQNAEAQDTRRPHGPRTSEQTQADATSLTKLPRTEPPEQAPTRTDSDVSPDIAQVSGNDEQSWHSTATSDEQLSEVRPAASEQHSPSLDPPSPEPANGSTMSLANVLYLADAQNPNVAVARARITEAYARVDRAEALWLPSIRAGLNFNHHEGNVQDVVGNVFTTNKSAFYGGLGANGFGSGSPAVPGVVAQFHLSDAIFQPKITSHQAVSRQYAATATRNDTLRSTAVTYLELVRAEQALVIAEEAYANTQKLARLTGEYARTGQGLRSDHERMLAEVAIRDADLDLRSEAADVASARLAQLLHADPSVRIYSGEPMVVPLDVLAVDHTAAEYVATGLSRRPELAEQKHLVCEAVERLRREKYAPLVPSVLLGFSYGGMGGGLGSSIVNADDRWDADAVAFWEVRNLGIGERSARNETSALVQQAQMRELAVLDQVAREVVEAHTQVLKRENRIAKARESIRAAERSYELNTNRIRNVQGLPIEVLQSIQALAAARLTYLNAVIDYNIAQFELCRAIGWFEGE